MKVLRALSDRIGLFAYENGNGRQVDLRLMRRIEKAEDDLARTALALRKLEAELRRRDRKIAAQSKPKRKVLAAKASPPPAPTATAPPFHEDYSKRLWMQHYKARNELLSSVS